MPTVPTATKARPVSAIGTIVLIFDALQALDLGICQQMCKPKDVEYLFMCSWSFSVYFSSWKAINLALLAATSYPWGAPG